MRGAHSYLAAVLSLPFLFFVLIAHSHAEDRPEGLRFIKAYYYFSPESSTMHVYENRPRALEIGVVEANGTQGDVQCLLSHPAFELRRESDGPQQLFLVDPLDREEQDSFNVTLNCSDAGSPPLTSSFSFTINVFDEDDNAPVFERDSYTFRVRENAPGETVLGNVSASDADKGYNAEVVYFINETAGHLFDVSRAGVVTTWRGLDREYAATHEVLVYASSDNSYSQTGTTTLTIIVSDENDNSPHILMREMEVPAGSRGGTVVGQLDATDADEGVNAEVEFFLLQADTADLPFAVSLEGVVSTTGDVSSDVSHTYLLNVMARDKGSPPISSQRVVTVRVV